MDWLKTVSLSNNTTVAYRSTDQNFQHPAIVAYKKEKKEVIWLSPITKDPVPTENAYKAKQQLKYVTTTFYYITITDWYRMVSWSDYSHLTGILTWFTCLTFHLPVKDHQSKGHIYNRNGNDLPYRNQGPKASPSGEVIKCRTRTWYVKKSMSEYSDIR